MALLVNAMLKVRGAEKWPDTEARVCSFNWESNARRGSPGGVTKMVYEYEINREVLIGEAEWEDPNRLAGYRRGDRIIVRYDPKRPSRSYFPQKQDLNAPFILALVLVVMLALVFLWMFVFKS